MVCYKEYHISLGKSTSLHLQMEMAASNRETQPHLLNSVMPISRILSEARLVSELKQSTDSPSESKCSHASVQEPMNNNKINISHIQLRE
jgi:hypothetical protein